MSDEEKENLETVALPTVHVSTSPHLSDPRLTTQRMMMDVIIGLLPAIGVSLYFFRWGALIQISLCVLASLAAEAIFTSMRGRKLSLHDGSAALTGIILALSLPWNAPYYVGIIGSFAAVGLGKAVFGGLGFNIFNPAMVGRAFVMLSFAGAIGAAGYIDAEMAGTVMTQATPLTALKQDGILTAIRPLLIGSTNGSLGEVSAIALLLGGIYICIRRVASWEIPAGSILSLLVLAGLANMAGLTHFTALHHLVSGAFLFGAFFIATDPVSSPVTRWGKFWFGVGFGFFVVVIRIFSGYPEGVMFAVLLMNAIAPLLNRWTIPTPVGGPVPQKA